MPDVASLPRMGFLNREQFFKSFQEQFGKDSRFGAGGLQRVLPLVEQIEQDQDITDIRWAAYMLATTTWETTMLVTVERNATNRKGKVLTDRKGRPVRVKHRHWEHAMAPVDEVGHGKGRRYHEPVKVKGLAAGDVRVTEHDGDQFLVKPDGTITNLTKNAKVGARDAAPAARAYQADDGAERVFFGRGYVQLTWWSNYVAAGVAISRGLDLLLDPEQVKDSSVAYKIMSLGMRTGDIFANGHSFTDYFDDTTTDYKGARHMVNGRDHAREIAEIALKFEKVLSAARNVPPVPRLP
jgi:hypothetical protein